MTNPSAPAAAEANTYRGEPFRCKFCDSIARYRVWFVGCGGAYTYYCASHTAEAVKYTVDGYLVSQIGILEPRFRGEPEGE